MNEKNVDKITWALAIFAVAAVLFLMVIGRW